MGNFKLCDCCGNKIKMEEGYYNAFLCLLFISGLEPWKGDFFELCKPCADKLHKLTRKMKEQKQKNEN